MSIDQFSQFFMSLSGQITTVVLVVVLALGFAVHLRKRKVFSVRVLSYAALCIALAMILSYVKLWDMPYGGTVTACSMFFIALIGLWFGSFAGITAAVAYGLLQLIADPYVIHPVQLLLDYPLAFGMLGLAGFFRNRKYGLYTGYLFGATARMLCSTLSGVLFFAEYAGDQNVWVYSITYNAFCMVPEMLITCLLLSIAPIKKAILQVKTSVV